MYFPTDYVVYDTETTGLDTRTARITELACKKIVGGVVTEKSWLIRQDAPIPEICKTLCGFTDEMLAKDGKHLRDVLIEFGDFVSDLPVIGHNILRYDNQIMAAEHVRWNFRSPMDEQRAFDGRDMLFDTAALFKARAAGIGRYDGESLLGFQSRVLDTRIAGLKYNLAVACATMGVDTAGIVAHRAAGDVEMTHRLYEKLTA